MPEGPLLALAAMVLFGLGDLVYKRVAQAGIPAHRFMMAQTWFFGACTAAYGVMTDSLRFDLAVLWAPVAGVFAFGGFYLFALSLSTGSVSVNAPIFRLSFVVTATLAVLILGESVTAFKVLGIALALAAVWMLVGGASAAAFRAAKRDSLTYVLVATAAVGVANLMYKIAMSQGAAPATLLFVQALCVAALSMGVTMKRDGSIRPDARTLRFSATSGLLIGSAFIFLLMSLQRGAASVMVPIAQMGFVVTALAGFVFLREPFTLRTGVGLLLALAALASLAMSG
ncbi:MAG: EamA family transporter [Burkholderiales bacterium]